MLSNRPYLLRAFYQWIVDSKCTPILVIANHPACRIPQEYVEDNEIVFNVSPNAVRDLKLANDRVEFKASFSGVIHMISAPVKAVLSIYAEENGEGLFFDADDETADSDEMSDTTETVDQIYTDSLSHDSSTNVPQRRKPILKLVE